jgi:hypothetical protein
MAKKPKMSAEFQRKLKAELKLRIREMQDGCTECIVLKKRNGRYSICDECYKAIADMIINPRKYIELT